MTEYRDAGTKAPLGEGALERRYLDSAENHNGPVSFDDWLRAEVDDGYIEATH